jgi:hypothetical protein
MKRFSWLLPAVVVMGAWGCQPKGDLPASYVADPRVLAIKAEPPEIAAGESTSVTAWVVGTDGQTPTVSWSRCRRAPLPGQAINPDCLANPQAAYVEPIGEGATITTTMPADVTPDALGLPDASGGVYLPLIARVTVAGEELTATYRLRLGQPGAVPNHNPVVAGVFVVDAAGETPLDEAVPYVVHEGDVVTLSVALPSDSAESYLSPLGGPSGGPVTEVITTSWFANGGDVGNNRTNNGAPSMVLHFDKRLPAVGAPIDLYLVARDERGGTDYAHRTFVLQ